VKEVPIGGSVIWTCPHFYYAEWTHKSLSGWQGIYANFSDLDNMNAKVYERNHYSNLLLTSVIEEDRGYYKCRNGRQDEYIYYLEVLGNNGSHNNISAPFQHKKVLRKFN